MKFLEKDLYITYDEFEAYINGEGPQKESSFRTSGTQGKPKSLWEELAVRLYCLYQLQCILEHNHLKTSSQI